MRLLFALAPLLCSVVMPAADDLDALLRGEEQLPWVDVRLGIGRSVIPDTYPVDATDFTTGVTTQWTDEMTTDSAVSVSYSVIGADLQPFGLVGGIELVYTKSNQHLYDRRVGGNSVGVPTDTPTVRYSSFGGNGLLGCGLALGPKAHLELLGVLGVGALEQGFINPTFDEQASGSGMYWNYGLRGGAYYRIGRFVLGMAVEYTHLECEAETNWATQSTSTEADASGIGYRLELGYHMQ